MKYHCIRRNVRRFELTLEFDPSRIGLGLDLYLWAEGFTLNVMLGPIAFHIDWHPWNTPEK